MEMDDFYEHLCKKSPNGIPYADAIQLMFLIFLTPSFLPKEFRGIVFSKINLAILFAKLSAKGKIIIYESDGVCVADVARPGHWENLVDGMLQRTMDFDETFSQRVGCYI